MAPNVNIDKICITGANRVQTSCQIWHQCQWFFTRPLSVRGEMSDAGLHVQPDQENTGCELCVASKLTFAVPDLRLPKIRVFWDVALCYWGYISRRSKGS